MVNDRSELDAATVSSMLPQCQRLESVMDLDPSVSDYLAMLTARSWTLLGGDLVGVYAAGSLALDAYEHGRSDIDIAIVCAGRLSLPVKRAIVDALRHESLPCPARGLELVVYRAEIALAGGSDPGFEVELNTGHGMAYRATWAGADRRQADGVFWYAIDRSILAERGKALKGPPAASVFRPVSERDLVALLIESLRWHLRPLDERPAEPESGDAPEPELGSERSSDLGDHAARQPAAWTVDAVLNACRAWQRSRTGRWSSKVAAGRHVLSENGSAGLDGGVVARALDARHGGVPPSELEAIALQRAVLAALESRVG